MRWHYRAKAKHRYLAIGLYNNTPNEIGLNKKYLSVERWILIHHGGGRNWSEGCLIPARKKPYIGNSNKYENIHMCDMEGDSKLYFQNIKDFVHKLESTVDNSKSHGIRINKVKIRVFNDIKNKR